MTGWRVPYLQYEHMFYQHSSEVKIRTISTRCCGVSASGQAWEQGGTRPGGVCMVAHIAPKAPWAINRPGLRRGHCANWTPWPWPAKGQRRAGRRRPPHRPIHDSPFDRASGLRRYAMAAGFRSIMILPIEHDLWRFYRLDP